MTLVPLLLAPGVVHRLTGSGAVTPVTVVVVSFRCFIVGALGQSVASGATGHAGVYREGFAVASASMVVLVAVTGVLFVVLIRKARRDQPVARG